jgi:GNAT superfamily N-acetyltransferase
MTTIRRLGPGDEPVLAFLAKQADDFDLAGLTEPEEPLADADAAAYLGDPGVLHWVAEKDGRVVGELLCHLLRLPSRSETQDGRELLLYSIGVKASERRRGVGRALVEEMRRWMRDNGVELVWVLADNQGAEEFYAAMGFVRGADNEQGVLMLLRTTGPARR